MKINITTIIVAVIILIVAGAVYFVFFAPAPVFEVIVPPPLKTAGEVSSKQINPANVLNSQAFRNLRPYAPSPTVGQIGRTNPFMPF
ncbi:MAG: hypothetical protein AAB454_01070 [Patescibacteria group bacterium]